MPNDKELKAYAESPFLAQLYALRGSAPEIPHKDHVYNGIHMGPDPLEVNTMGPKQCDNLKLNALKGVTKHMCTRCIPNDPGTDDEIMDDVDQIVNKYFTMNSGKILQYFADTRNTVADIVREAMDDTMEKIQPDSEDNEAFITAVVDQVKDNEDVETVMDTIEKDIKKSAENDIKNIIDKIKDDETEDDSSASETTDAVAPPAQEESANINESVFHHYLIKQYKENVVPEDPETMLVVPMVETALHYVRRVLFSDGFGRRLRENG